MRVTGFYILQLDLTFTPSFASGWQWCVRGLAGRNQRMGIRTVSSNFERGCNRCST